MDKIYKHLQTSTDAIVIPNCPVFPHPCLYASDFNCCHVVCGYDDNSADSECLAGWASINSLTLLYNAKDAARFYSGCWNTGTNPNLALVQVLTVSYKTDAFLKIFPGHNSDLCLLHHQGWVCQCQAGLLSDETSTRPNGVITLL